MELRLGIPRAPRTAIACLLLPLHLAACTTWQVANAPIPEVIAASPDRVRLVPPAPPARTEPASIDLRNLHAEGDSLIGYRYSDSTRMSVPRSAVERVNLFSGQLTFKRPPDVRRAPVVEVWHPRLAADSIVGFRVPEGGARSSISVPLASFAHVETNHFSAEKTVGLLLGTAALLVVGFFSVLVIGCSTSGGCG